MEFVHAEITGNIVYVKIFHYFTIFDISVGIERSLCCDGNHNQDGSDPGITKTLILL